VVLVLVVAPVEASLVSPVVVVAGVSVVLVVAPIDVVGAPDVVASQPELVPLETSASLVESPTG
jgi:hypothetical protein